MLVIAIFILVTGAGAGITAFLLPTKLREALIPISFWTGVLWIAISGVVLSQIGISTRQSSIMIVGISATLLAVAIKQGKLKIKVDRLGVVVAVFSAILVGVHLFTYLTKAPFATTISMGNLDPISYSTVADYLQTHTVKDGSVYEAFSPYLWSVGDLLHSSYRWGTPMVLSVISSIFGMRAYQVFGVLIQLFFVMSYPMLFALMRQLRPKAGVPEAIILFLVYGLNSTLMYTLYNVFFAQFAWGGILILSVYLAMVKDVTWLRALVIAGTSLIYPEGIIFVILPILLLGQWKALGLALLLTPYSMYTAIKQLITVMITSSKVTWIGWEHIRYPNMFEILGMYNLNYSRPIPVLILIIPLIALLILMFWGFMRSQKKRVLLVYLGVFTLAYISTLASGNWFTYYRAITYSIFIYTIIFVAGLGVLFEKLKSKHVRILIIAIIALVVTRSSVRTAKQMYYHHHMVDASLISLGEVPRSSSVIGTADLILGEYSLWIRLWREYILAGQPLLTRQNLTTDSAKLDVLGQILVEKERVEELGQRINLKQELWENSYYEIYEVDIKVNQI